MNGNGGAVFSKSIIIVIQYNAFKALLMKTKYHVIYLTFYSTLLGWMISVELDEEKAGRLYLLVGGVNIV
jgi:hypothetical protein